MATPRKLTVIDIDGTILDIHTPLEKMMKFKGYADFNINRVLTYDFNKSLVNGLIPTPEWLIRTDVLPEIENSYYMNAPRDLLLSTLSDSSLFTLATIEDLFADNIQAIRRICEDTNVVFHTLSFTDEIADIKRIWLHNQLHKSDIWNYVLSSEVGTDKTAYEGVDFVIEDCIENLQNEKYTNALKILIDRSYNRYNYEKCGDLFAVVSNLTQAANVINAHKEGVF